MKNKKTTQVGAIALVVIALAATTVATTIGSSLLSASVIAQGFFVPKDIEETDQDREQLRWFNEWKTNETRHLKDRTRECKDKTNQVKRIAKKFGKDAGIQEAAAQVKVFCAGVETAKKCLSAAKSQDDQSDCQEIIQDQVGNIGGDLNDLLNEYQGRFDVFDGIKNNKNQCKDKAREIKNILGDAKRNKVNTQKIEAFRTEAEARIRECQDKYSELTKLANSGSWDEARDILQEHFWNNDFWQWKDEQRQELLACNGVSQVIQQTEKEIKMAKNATKSFAKKGKNTSSIDRIISEAEGVIQSAKSDIASGNCDDGSRESILGELDDLRQQYESELETFKSESYGGEKSRKSGPAPAPSGDERDLDFGF